MTPSCGLAIALLAGVTAGCGYHVGGQASQIPPAIKTIAIPAFANATPRFALARLLPADITREFLSRTHYAIVADPAGADAVLTGALTNFSAFSITTDPVSNRSTGVQIVANLNITLTDRHTGKVLYSRIGAEFRERYEISISPTAYFDESGTAVRRVSQDVARTVVTGILEGF